MFYDWNLLWKKKPDSFNEFLKDFVEELKVIECHGVVINSKKVLVSIRCIICDAPAKSSVLYTAGHNSFHACNQGWLDGGGGVGGGGCRTPPPPPQAKF